MGFAVARKGGMLRNRATMTSPTLACGRGVRVFWSRMIFAETVLNLGVRSVPS
jgi:hypothetical protein